MTPEQAARAGAKIGTIHKGHADPGLSKLVAALECLRITDPRWRTFALEAAAEFHAAATDLRALADAEVPNGKETT